MERKRRTDEMTTILVVSVFLLVVGFMATHTLAQSDLNPQQTGYEYKPWPCCDNCGGCTKSTPPRCQCRDLVSSCHPSCRNCVQSPLSVDPPMYMCVDRVINYCRRRCTPESIYRE